MKKTLKRPNSPKNDAISYSVTQLYYDIETVKMQMEVFTDAELYEYCSFHIDMYKHKELDRLYSKIADGAKLAEKERKDLEAFCILANTELCLSV